MIEVLPVAMPSATPGGREASARAVLQEFRGAGATRDTSPLVEGKEQWARAAGAPDIYDDPTFLGCEMMEVLPKDFRAEAEGEYDPSGSPARMGVPELGQLLAFPTLSVRAFHGTLHRLLIDQRKNRYTD